MVQRVKCLPCRSHGPSASPDKGLENQLTKLSFDLHTDITYNNSEHNFKSSLCSGEILKKIRKMDDSHPRCDRAVAQRGGGNAQGHT